MNRQKLAEIKYDLQGQLKMKLHKLEVYSKEKGGRQDEFLAGYRHAIEDLGILVPNWKHENVSNENNPKVFPDEEGETNENS
tara:strand:- start:231 stop:476 length:246 start_codon:yes stop_codon:yes gene_type:complete